MDNELYEILSAFRDSLDAVNHKLEELEGKSSKIDEIEARLENEVIKPSLEKIQHDEDEASFNDFHNKYGEKLDKFSGMMKSIRGDDFDASRDAYEGWKSYEAPEGYEKPAEADGYIDAYVSVIEKKIAEIKEALNLPEEAEIEVKSDGENVEVEIENDETVVDKPAEEVEETITDEGDIFDDEAVEGKLSEEDIKEIEDLKKEFKGWN